MRASFKKWLGVRLGLCTANHEERMRCRGANLKFYVMNLMRISLNHFRSYPGMLSQTQTCDALGHRLSFTAETLIRKQSISLRECQPLLHLCDNFYREGGTGLQRHLSIIYNQLMMIAEEDGMNLQAQIRFAKVVCSFSYWRVAAPNINGELVLKVIISICRTLCLEWAVESEKPSVEESIRDCSL